MKRTDLTEVSDAALVMRVSRYQQDALAEAYRRHAGAVYGLSRRLLSDSAMAEEIVQEVFLRLWNEPEKFDPGQARCATDLLAQCHGRSVDRLRAESSRRQREKRDARRTAEAGYDLEHEVWDLEVVSVVKDAMVKLPSEERAAIELAYFGGKTYREVATVSDQPEGTVKEPDPIGHAADANRAGKVGRGHHRRPVMTQLTHEQIEQLGGDRLDAVDAGEREAIEAHLPECPRCRAEVAELREVVALLANNDEEAPEGVWDRIAEAIEDTPPPMRLDVGRRRQRRWAPIVLAAAAVVALLLLGWQVVDLRRQNDDIQKQLAAAEVTSSGINEANLALLARMHESCS